MDLPMVKLVQSKGWDTQQDCGICAVATITCKTYEEVVSQAERLGIKWKTGMYVREIVALAAAFGIVLRRKRKIDPEHDTGILTLALTEEGRPKEHVVLLKEGLIIDWDGMIWEHDAFVDHYAAKVCLLLG